MSDGGAPNLKLHIILEAVQETIEENRDLARPEQLEPLYALRGRVLEELMRASASWN